MKSSNKINLVQKLSIVLVLIMLSINGVAIYIVSHVMEQSLVQTEHKYLNEIIKNISGTTEQTVFEYVAICDVLAKSNTIVQLLRESNGDTITMATHPNAPLVVAELSDVINRYTGDIMSMAVFDIEEDGYMLNTGVVSGDDFSFKERPYYASVLTKEFIITQPYQDVLTKGMVVTIASPVIDRGEVLGVVGIDLPIDFVSVLVMDSSYGSTGRSFVLDQDNIILAYSDPSYINHHYTDLNITGSTLEDEIISPSGNLVEYEFKGEKRLGLVSKIDSLNWTVVTAMDYSEFDQISAYIIALLVISMILTLLFCWMFISGKFSKELSLLHYKDSLTGLYNRAGFSQRLDELLSQSPKTMGVISVNINGLKHINENAGISSGDKHIKASAQRLTEHFSFELFRMSGDEFVGIAPNMEKDLFEEKVNSLHQIMDDEKIYDFSLGHCWGQGSLDLWKLLSEAETMMYINKQKYYAQGFHSFDHMETNFLTDLLSYLENDEFMVYLQPQVHLKDGSLYGAEALIRRFDKTNEKMVFPDQFIPLYEQKSIIRHVDLFVVDTVCKLIKEWDAFQKSIPISVNLSRVTLQEAGIVKTITALCDKHKIPHHLLVIEVTERVGLIENNVASSLIEEFKENGFHISLDDFGCAYSNIVTLAQIQVDEVKIDKSLVDHILTNEKNAIIVENVLSMCNALKGTSTLAEGIEEEAQANILHQYGCHLGQGYFYSRPIPHKEFYEKYITS